MSDILSFDFPSVNSALKYVKTLDAIGIVGGSPQIDKPARKNGRQMKPNEQSFKGQQNDTHLCSCR